MSQNKSHNEDVFDVDRIEAIAARLDLRAPNRDAVESIVFELAQHFDVEGRSETFEGVVDVATGVGKTFIIAGTLEYLAGDGVSDFAIITPGRTILEKTVANFTPGAAKSLLGGMEFEPVVVTSDNFDSADIASTMNDPTQVKLYIFTVQALLKPKTSTVGKKTHEYQEGLGDAFYAHLQGVEDLVVFADEHHAYFGAAFSKAVHELQPRVLIGLTATPHRKTSEEDIIYRYPLAAAIADKLVKTPVIVGRKDDKTDVETKMRDGVRLLKMKEEALRKWAETHDGPTVNPVMLVIAPDIAEAEEIAAVAQSAGFIEGEYAGKVLTVHSEAPDEALNQLAKLEDADSPHRIVISVGMLKEGWDVKNVYVIASMRASVSSLLTEQTLGRGLRLPFGQYTDVQLLDTLEVLGHERYEELLKKAGVLNEHFIDRRTRAVLQVDSSGKTVAVSETTETPTPIPVAAEETIKTVDEAAEEGKSELASLSTVLAPKESASSLKLPRLLMTPLKNEFSLADITDVSPFRDLGQRLSTDPVDELRRTAITSRVVMGDDGIRRTEVVRTTAVDKVTSPPPALPLDDLESRLSEAILASPVVPARRNQRAALTPLLAAVLEGLGD